MRSLFLRIFLWFWVTLLAVVTVLVVFSPLLTQTRPRLAQWETHAEEWVMGRVERVAQEIHQHGLEELGSERGRYHHGPGPGRMAPPRVMVFDVLGNEVSGQPADVETRSLALQAVEHGQPMTQRVGGRHLSARPVTDPNGKRMVVVGVAERPPQLTDLLEPRYMVPRLGALALVAGLLVFWLAYHLSSPVSVLRSATKDIASGNLAARVGSKVTRRRDEIGQLGRDFNAMAARVEALVSAQRQLLQDVSHELRSPLARLRVALELARRRSGERAHDRIELECERLEELIGGLLEITRLEGVLSGSEAVDLVAVLREVVADARFESGNENITLEIASSEPLILEGDQRLLRSAIDNVVRNAVDYTPTEAGVDVAVTSSRNEVTVQVCDRGPGVPEHALEGIFEPFFRVERSRDLRHGGTGLGLAIAARAIRLHGGTIRAVNRQGGGLLVEIRLPARR